MSEDNQEQIKSNNVKIAVTAVISVLLGAALLLALINYGIQFQRNLDKQEAEKRDKEKVVSILGVDYSTKSFEYHIPNGPMTKEQQEEVHERSSLKTDKYAGDNDYFIINSGTKLRDVLSVIDADDEYSVDDSFFLSGSIVAVVKETYGVSKLEVTNVSRDENYDIQIDAKTEGGDDVMDATTCHVVFVKIPNLQPKNVAVKID